MRVLVLHQAVSGTRSDELDTLVQVSEVSAQLRSMGHRVTCTGITTAGEAEQKIVCERAHVVFNLVESLGGSDRFAYLVPGLLESLRIPFTGNHALPMMLASDKITLKSVLLAEGIATPRGLEAGEDIRYIVKSVSEHASFGLDAGSVVKGVVAAQQLIADKTAQYGGNWLAEEYIEGREFNLALLETNQGLLMLPPAEIVFDDFDADQPHIVDYAAKWDASSPAYYTTPRRFGFPAHALWPLMKKIWNTLQLSGYARIDIRMDSSGNWWVIDVNPNPCLSADAGFVAAACEQGMTQQSVVRDIIERATRGICFDDHHDAA